MKPFGVRSCHRFGKLIRPNVPADEARRLLFPQSMSGALPDTASRLPTVGFASTEKGLWRLEVRGVTFRWPEGFELRALPTSFKGWPFELAAPDGGRISLKGPLRGNMETPAPSELIGPHQEIVGWDLVAMWIDLRLEQPGRILRLRHQYAVPAPDTVVLVSARAIEGRHAPIFRAAAMIAGSVELHQTRQSLDDLG